MVNTSSESWTHSEHCDEYSGKVRSSHQLLLAAWEQLEISPDKQDEFLREICLTAERAWDQAVHVAETGIETAKEQTKEAERRTAKLRADLSDEHFTSSQVEEKEPPTSVQGKLQAAQDELRIWVERRNARQQRYDTLKGKCEQLRHQLGVAGSSVPVKTVTLYALDGLAMELQNLEVEQAERQKRLESRLKTLRKHCMNLGEDEGKVAAQIHESLGASRDAQSSGQNLSDKTFDGLRTAVLQFEELEQLRSEQAEVLLNTLQSLWEAMNVPKDDLDREIFTKLMTGQSRLHKGSHERCTQEIGRLEGARKDLMMTIIDQKRQNIAAICKTSHMAVPALPAYDTQEPGEISDALARTLKQLGAVTSEAEHRKPVLDAISGLQATLTEAEWLAAYEDDPNKYKGRDSTRKIQRAIAAAEQRKLLPSMADNLKELLDTYRNEHNLIFMYDGQSYQTTTLQDLVAQIEEEEQKRLQGNKSKGQASALKAQKPAVSTPRRGATGATGGKPATAKKPLVPPLNKTPLTDRRANAHLSRTSSVSRTDSISSARSDLDAVTLTSRVSKLLSSNVSSPAVSRTTSNMSSTIDAEVASTSQIPKLKMSKKQEKPAPTLKLADPAALTTKTRKLDLEATENDDKISNIGKIPAVYSEKHRRSVSG